MSGPLFSVKRHWSSEPMLAAGGGYTEGVTGSAAPVSEVACGEGADDEG
jgi:hypothetical protein